MYLECIKLKKFNNTLMKDENYAGEIRELISQIRESRKEKLELLLSGKLKFPNDWKNLIIKYVTVIIYQT